MWNEYLVAAARGGSLSDATRSGSHYLNLLCHDRYAQGQRQLCCRDRVARSPGLRGTVNQSCAMVRG